MSKALQFVIGIGVIVLVAAAVFSSVAPYFLPRMMMARVPLSGMPQRMVGPRLPFMPGFLFGLGSMGFRFPFLRLFGLTACVWPLLIVGLIVLSISLLTRRPAPRVMTMPPAPANFPQASAPQGMPAAPVSQAAPVSVAECTQCGQPLQPGWRHCPSCGAPIGA